MGVNHGGGNIAVAQQFLDPELSSFAVLSAVALVTPVKTQPRMACLSVVRMVPTRTFAMACATSTTTMVNALKKVSPSTAPPQKAIQSGLIKFPAPANPVTALKKRAFPQGRLFVKKCAVSTPYSTQNPNPPSTLHACAIRKPIRK
jgi:hypothetical protein